MKKNITRPAKRRGLVLAMMSIIPRGECTPSDYPEERESDDQIDENDSQNINKDPIMGGAEIDPVPPEDEPGSDDLNDENFSGEEINEDLDNDELSTPFDTDEEDSDVSTLQDDENLMGEDSEIDDETTI